MKLKQWLEENDVSVVEFASRIGVSRQTVYNWLKGRPPSISEMLSISEETNRMVTMSDMVTRKEKKVRKGMFGIDLGPGFISDREG